MTAPPRTTPLRIGYFVTSYGDGRRLLRLVRTLRDGDPDAEIVVHHDDTHHPAPAESLDALGVHLLPSSERIVWGDMTLERARWRVFAWILAHLDVDWVVLLSEQDHPTAPLTELRDLLGGTTANAVIEAWPIDEIPDPDVRVEADQRYRYRYVELPGVSRGFGPAWFRRLGGAVLGVVVHRLRVHRMPVRVYAPVPSIGVPARVGVRARTPFSDSAPCWYANSWFALDRHAVGVVVEHVMTDPALVLHFARTMIPVEAATATMLGNDPRVVLEHRSIHTIRWTDPTSGRPDVFGLGDVDALVHAPEPFARKFGPDETVLDAIDARVRARRAPRRAVPRADALRADAPKAAGVAVSRTSGGDPAPLSAPH